jgi:MFS family permease
MPSSGNALLALLCTAQLVLTLDFSIVNVALPTIQRELHFSSANLQWLVTGYALTFGSLLLLSGRAGDLLGRRRLLVIGLLVFVVSSLTCDLAQSSLMLITSRIVQGVGGAMISPTALALLTINNPEGPTRNRAIGLWQAAAAIFNTSQQVGSAVGLSILATIAASASHGLGGTLTGSFRVSYLVGAGIAALGIIVVASMLSARQCQSELTLQAGASHAS